MEMDLVEVINSSGMVDLRHDAIPTAVLGLLQLPYGSGFRVDNGETKTHVMMVFTEYVDGKIERQNLFVRPKNSSGMGMVYAYEPKKGAGILTVRDDQEAMSTDVFISRLRAYGVNKF